MFFAVVAISDSKLILNNNRFASNLRVIDVWGFLDYNGVWKFSESMTGYAQKDSAIGKRLLQFLKDGKSHTCFVHLKPAASYISNLGTYELVDFEEIEAEELE